MTLTQYLDVIAEKLDIGALPDKLLSTYLEAFAIHEGVDVNKLPNRLVTTYLEEILKARGVYSCCDKLRATQLNALAGTCGENDLPDKLISTYLEAIIKSLDTPRQIVQFVLTGDESFNFQSADNTVYYKNNDFASIPHDDILFASCTHFKWGSGAVIANMNDGEFIFNYTVSTGIGTGNVSFKNTALFTSNSEAKAWFKEQAENGTPVIVTAHIAE